MATSKSVKRLRGNWIWKRETLHKKEGYLFCRKEFSVDFGSVPAELWISAHTACQIYVNGYFVGHFVQTVDGPIVHAENYDVSSYLEPGTNTVAILAYRSLSGQLRRPSAIGIWCQLNIDGEPYLWTDDQWLVLEGECYERSRRLQNGFRHTYVERCEANRAPNGWTEANFQGINWHHPDYSLPVTKIPVKFKVSTIPPPVPQVVDTRFLVRGKYVESSSASHVVLHEIYRGEPCAYAAESFFYCKRSSKVKFVLVSDEELRFFANGKEVHPDGDSKPITGREPCRTRHYEVATEPEWNRILIAFQAVTSSSGFYIQFDGAARASFHFQSEESLEAMEGWTLYGPLQVPFKLIGPSIAPPHGKSFFPMPDNLEHTSAYYDNCRYLEEGNTVSDTNEEDEEEETASEWILKRGEYMIFDLSEMKYGIPTLTLVGFDGDIVDVTYGNEMANGRLMESKTVSAAGNTDTLILKGDETRWTRFHPRLCRYLMISVRDTSESVLLGSVSFQEIRNDWSTRTEFECSDPQLNRIWQIGVNTLSKTVVSSFMDEPVEFPCQQIGFAMIQSLALGYSHGEYRFSEKTLEDFACVQHEDGKIPLFTQGGPEEYHLDVGMLWPVWLDQFLQTSGNSRIRNLFLPKIAGFLEFLASIADEDDLLREIDRKFGYSCFIDYGTVDRRGMITGLNALYCRTLFACANLYEQAGMRVEANACRKLAKKIVTTIRELAWDEKSELFADCVCHGRKSSRHSYQTNLLALYSGIARPDQFDVFVSRFLLDRSPFVQKEKMILSPYFNYFLLETMFSYGQSDWAFDFIRHYWGDVLKTGAECWPEFHDPAAKPGSAGYRNGALCHGSGVSPNIFLIRELVGIRPAEPGFKTLYFNPAIGSASRAAATIPTPLGNVAVEWRLDTETGDLQVRIDSEYEVDVAPLLPDETLAKTVFDLGASVHILAK